MKAESTMGAKLCIVAGYYGTENAWRKFERGWSKVLVDYPELKRDSTPKISFRENGRRVCDYAAWTHEKANK